MIGSSRVIIQDRDRRLLAELGVMRVIDREQAKIVADFHSTTRANVRLLTLTRFGFLTRSFTGTIYGGRKAVYSLSRTGAALIGVTYRPIRHRLGETAAASLFLEHQMRLNEVYCAVKHERISVADVRYRRWLTFQSPLSPAIPLVPDGYFELETGSEIRPMFVEVDLGNEALRIWRKKMQAYLQLAVSGEFARLFQQSRFRVLVLMPSQRRLRTVRAAIAKTTDKIFWFTTLAQIKQSGIWSPIWLRPNGDQQHPLV